MSRNYESHFSKEKTKAPKLNELAQDNTAVKYRNQDSKLNVMTTKPKFFLCCLLFAYLTAEAPAGEEIVDKARR